MEFEFHCIEQLPKLSCCARFEAGSQRVAVAHGPWVETEDSFFVEGAWDADFSQGQIDATHWLMGSDGRLVHDSVVIATPCHTLDRLFSTRDERSLFISNSLPLLLEAARLELDVRYHRYTTDLWSIGNGLDRCVTHFSTASCQAAPFLQRRH